jgi:hypothetical protein
MESILITCASVWLLTYLVSRVVNAREKEKERRKYMVEQLIKAYMQKRKIDRLYGRDGEE